jgi:phage shock protein C
MQRKLVRSQTDSRIAGVCGGLGEYLDVDPTLIRLIFVLLALTGGHGLLLYFILWIIMPPADQARAI